VWFDERKEAALRIVGMQIRNFGSGAPGLCFQCRTFADPVNDDAIPGLHFQTETRVFPVAARNILVAVASNRT
jgi:hypothetical protein